MTEAMATIRELRLNFREVKRKMEQHGRVLITDHGKPLYQLNRLEEQPATTAPLPDYYGRLRRQRSLTARDTQALHEENRG